MTTEFQVRKNDLNQHRLVEREDLPLAEGEIRLKIDRFAFTANNLTYGAAGDILSYWKFFPAADNAEGQWGIIPVWAFADVVESRCDELPVGERLYGYFPPATTLTMRPDHIKPDSLFDGTVHRQVLPPLYNRYSRVLADPNYNRTADAARILLAPLHVTSYCLWDLLQNHRYFRSKQVVIVSASSKTSIGLAWGLAADSAAPNVVGLTSHRNLEFVIGLGLYNRVIEYDRVESDLRDEPTVVVDMAGNPAVRKSLQTALGENLHQYVSVGMTHWDEPERGNPFEAGAERRGERAFFAPGYMMDRSRELEPGVFEKTSATFVGQAARAIFQWMDVDSRSGLEALCEVYPAVCAGGFSPASGLVIEMT